MHNTHALTVYAALAIARSRLDGITIQHLSAAAQQGGRVAAVIATGGRFASTTIAEFAQHYSWLRGRIRIFSVLLALPALVQALNTFQPAFVVGYSTALILLAQEQRAGRLHIRPTMVVTVSEGITPAARHQIEEAFACPVRTIYAASEFIGIAFDCRQGWLHVNSDWVILEPVTATYHPVPPGQASSTVLLTNLANRVQPLIRYDLGDSITVSPEPCPCGSPLPAIRVEGRQDEILSIRTQDGKVIPLLPMAVATVVEETPGVHRFQVIQTAPATLRIRLAVAPGEDPQRVWDMVTRRLQDYLSAQGAPMVTLDRASEPPSRDPTSGKFRQVWQDMMPQSKRTEAGVPATDQHARS
jgi:phenylacetate-coenzyme A ligase PaaK-like adenylate-forming protein